MKSFTFVSYVRNKDKEIREQRNRRKIRRMPKQVRMPHTTIYIDKYVLILAYLFVFVFVLIIYFTRRVNFLSILVPRERFRKELSSNSRFEASVLKHAILHKENLENRVTTDKRLTLYI